MSTLATTSVTPIPEIKTTDATSKNVTGNGKLPWESAVSAAVASAISRTVVAPMERVRLQLSVDAAKYKGTVDCFRQIAKHEGLKGYWRGNLINVYRIAPQGAVAFVTKDYFKELFGGKNPNSFHLAAASCMSGVACMSAIYPLDFVRGQVTTNPGVYRGLWDGLSTIKRASGFKGLYKGLSHANTWAIAYYGMQFFTYDSLKKLYMRFAPKFGLAENGNVNVGPVVGLFFGGAAGATCTTFAYPFELARRKLQVQGLQGRPVLYSGMGDCLVKVYRSEGVLGWYRGLAANMLKSPLSVAIVFAVYEGLMDFFARMQHPSSK